MNPFRKTKLKAESKSVESKAVASGKKAYMASEKKSMSMKGMKGKK